MDPNNSSGDIRRPNSGNLNNKTKNYFKKPGCKRVSSIVGLILLAIIAGSLITMVLQVGASNNVDTSDLNPSELQAVDISVGGSSSDQIYFGNIKSISSKDLVINNVYYIPASSSSSTSSTSSNITLQPLVCQVDAPNNQMVINRTSVNWWENLKNNGKVAKTILSYEKQHKSGPTCPTSSPAS